MIGKAAGLGQKSGEPRIYGGRGVRDRGVLENPERAWARGQSPGTVPEAQLRDLAPWPSVSQWEGGGGGRWEAMGA